MEFPFPIVRNASPYWDLGLYDPNQVQSAAPGQLLSVMGGIDARILRKVERIKYTDSFNASGIRDRKGNKKSSISKVEIEFKNLSLDEAEHPMFDKGVGIQVYLGWYDWFCIKQKDDLVFSGVVKELRYAYAEAGIGVSMELYSLPAIKLMQGLKGDFLKKSFAAKTLKDFLSEVCSWTGLGCIYFPHETLDKLDKSPKGWGGKPWTRYPLRIWDNVQRRWRSLTPYDVLTRLAERYGQVFTLREDYIWFGSPAKLQSFMREKYRKFFFYRQGHGVLFPPEQLFHQDEDVFAGVEILEREMESSVSRGAARINRDKKKVDSVVEKRDGLVSKGIKVSGGNELSPEQLTLMLNRSQRTVSVTKLLAESKATAVKPIADAVPGALSKEEAQAILDGMNKYGASREMMIRVSGAFGDPTFKAGHMFFFAGIPHHHTGEYLADLVEQEVSSGGFLMSITGSMPRPEDVSKANAMAQKAKAQSAAARSWPKNKGLRTANMTEPDLSMKAFLNMYKISSPGRGMM